MYTSQYWGIYPAGFTVTPASDSDSQQHIQMTNHVVSLETSQSHNEIRNSICASNGYHSFTYWPLLASYNKALSAPCAIQYLIYCSCFMIGRTGGRLLKGRDMSTLAAWPSSRSFTFWVFSGGNWNISSWRNRCNKTEIAVECPLKVDWIEIQGITLDLAVRATIERLLRVEKFLRKDTA